MKNFFLGLNLFVSIACTAQKYMVEKSNVTFYSHTALEDIKAQNLKSSGIFDVSTSNVAFSIPIKDFVFSKALMQEHFNERYMESDIFPKSVFQGKITGYDAQGNALQNVTVTGELTIHNVSKHFIVLGTLSTRGGKIKMRSKFIVRLMDYNIEIPQIVGQQIAEQVEVTVEFVFKTE